MKIGMIAFGGKGDLYPFIRLGLSLASRGHDITLYGQPSFEDYVRLYGLHYVKVDITERYGQFVEEKDLTAHHFLDAVNHLFLKEEACEDPQAKRV